MHISLAQENTPQLIFWETTQVCNLECSHCRASAENKRSPLELTTRECKTFIDQVASFSRPILVLSGGEPLLRNDIYEVSQYATDAGIKVALATNATLITKEVAERLKGSEVKIVAVSVYGSTEEEHDNFCGENGAFEKTARGIENLKKANIPIQVNTTITKRNLEEMIPLNDLAMELGAVAYHVFFLVPTGRGKAIEGDELSPEEYEKAFNRLYDLEDASPLKIKATCAPHYYRVMRQRRALEEKDTSRGDAHHVPITKGCLVGQSVCFVSFKGEVFGCGYLPIAAGDVRKENFKKIWHKSELFNILRDCSKLEGKCGICEFKKVCSGCRARAFAATGNYLDEEPYCIYEPPKISSMGNHGINK